MERLSNVRIVYGHRLERMEQSGGVWRVTAGELTVETPYVLNATYAGISDIHSLLGLEPFHVKYELCETILCTASDNLKNVGLTVADGPFSIMPFGKTGYHSLTSVTFTPHETSNDSVATFPCQKRSGGCCTPERLFNCNDCPAKSESAWPYMNQLARKYTNVEI